MNQVDLITYKSQQYVLESLKLIIKCDIIMRQATIFHYTSIK